MSKSNIIDAVASATGTSKAQARETVNATFEAVKAELNSGESVRLTGFGTFKKETRRARNGRNPQTGETMTIPAKEVVKFKPSF